MPTTDFFRSNQVVVYFVVPPLNRGKYVLRAVHSCLKNDDENVSIEVVVIDSSNDGSFEELQQEFSADNRVKLLQNPSGSGPIKSWRGCSLYPKFLGQIDITTLRKVCQ
jgi:cellulose synthase/poly-beta-1,6-N-acetylglucosamine synthase-like glycosyltransferase